MTIVNIVNPLAADEFRLLDDNFCSMHFITIKKKTNKPEIFYPSITGFQKQGPIFLNSTSSRFHGTKQHKQTGKTRRGKLSHRVVWAVTGGNRAAQGPWLIPLLLSDIN